MEMTELDRRIAAYRQQNEDFIYQVREAFNDTEDTKERSNRHGVFDTLLNLATYALVTELETEFNKTLPKGEDEAIVYIKNQIREIHGICTGSLRENHEVYESLFKDLDLSSDEKAQGRRLLGNAVSALILEKTNNIDDVEALSSVSRHN